MKFCVLPFLGKWSLPLKWPMWINRWKKWEMQVFKRAVKIWYDILVYKSAELFPLKMTHIFYQFLPKKHPPSWSFLLITEIWFLPLVFFFFLLMTHFKSVWTITHTVFLQWSNVELPLCTVLCTKCAINRMQNPCLIFIFLLHCTKQALFVRERVNI